MTTWLHRIVVNACLDRLRQQQRPQADRAAARRPGPARPSWRRKPAPDPVEQQEQRDDHGRALAQLNADQRAALVLVDMEGYSGGGGRPDPRLRAGTVKSRCARGRARLVPLLAHLKQAG